MRPPRRFAPCFGIALFFFSSFAQAEPKPLAALFQSPKATKSKAKKAPVTPIPEEYRAYFKAKEVLSRSSDVAAIESAEKEVLLSRFRAQTKNLDKELEEVFYALEIKRGIKLANQKKWKPALDSFHRGLGGLPTFKWIYYWSTEASQALAQVCNRNKKVRDEVCLTLAKRVGDAFPKVALETKVLRDLPLSEPIVGNNEGYGDRLSQTYTEKTEKDEEAFQEVLANYLSGKDIDLAKSGKEFLNQYPKSILRFRATFLMAESLTRTGGSQKAIPLYQSLIDQLPLSFYAIVSAQRIGVNLRDRVRKEPVLVDPETINANLYEKLTLDRAKALLAKNHDEEVGIELEALSRVRAYSNQFILYLMRFAHEANQNLTTFKFANELVQRKYDGFYANDLLNMIFPDRYLKEIEEQATLNHADPLVVLSLMKQESGFKAPILSSSGALGLMQLMPVTAVDTKKDLLLSTLKEPAVNIAVGTKYLGMLLEKYDGNVPYALAAYNAGPHRVSKWRKDNKTDMPMMDWIESIPYKETRDYVMAILRNLYWYQYRKGIPPQNIFDVWKQPNAPATAAEPMTSTATTPTPAASEASSASASSTPMTTVTPAPSPSPSASPVSAKSASSVGPRAPNAPAATAAPASVLTPAR